MFATLKWKKGRARYNLVEKFGCIVLMGYCAEEAITHDAAHTLSAVDSHPKTNLFEDGGEFVNGSDLQELGPLPHTVRELQLRSLHGRAWPVPTALP